MDKPLRHIDHMMWDVNTPNSLVTITGMMIFEKKVSLQKLLKVTEERLLQYERFKKKVIIRNNKPIWHLDEAFCLSSHIHHIALPEPGNYKMLQEVISDLISEPLDYSKPLWQAHLIDNYNGGSVIVWRIHHAIADGIALIKVVFSLTAASRATSLVSAIKHVENEAEAAKISLKQEVNNLMQSGKDLYHQAQQLIHEPKYIKDALKESWSISKELGRLFFGTSVTGIMYKGELGYRKNASWSEALPLQEIKQIGKQFHATVNDMLLVLITGALRRHLTKHKQPLDQCIRIVVPVNARKKGEPIKVHNKIGMLSIELPVHLKKMEDRIIYIVGKTKALKHSIEPVLIYNLLHIVADVIPQSIEQKFSNFLGTKIAGVVTNVPGPKEAIYLAGYKVKDIMFWVPQTNPLGIGISIISYNNRVCLGVVTDENLVKNPDEIIKGYYKEFETMRKLLH